MKPPLTPAPFDFFAPTHLKGQAFVDHVQRNLVIKWGCDAEDRMIPFATESDRLAWLQQDPRRRVGGISPEVRQVANLARRAAERGNAEALPAHLR